MSSTEILPDYEDIVLTEEEKAFFEQPEADNAPQCGEEGEEHEEAELEEPIVPEMPQEQHANEVVMENIDQRVSFYVPRSTQYKCSNNHPLTNLQRADDGTKMACFRAVFSTICLAHAPFLTVFNIKYSLFTSYAGRKQH